MTRERMMLLYALKSFSDFSLFLMDLFLLIDWILVRCTVGTVRTDCNRKYEYSYEYSTVRTFRIHVYVCTRR